MVKAWRVMLVRESGRQGSMLVEADNVEVSAGGYLLLKKDGVLQAAVAAGSWISVEGLDTQHIAC